MADVVLRPVQADDFPAVLEIRTRVAAEEIWIGVELPLDLARERAAFDQALEGRESGTATIVLAEVEGVAVGSIWMLNSRGLASLGMNIVDGHRGQGIGTALVDEALSWARQHGAHKVTLDHWPWNEAGRRLYEKFGFVQEGYRRRQWKRQNGELWDSVMMGLVLDEAAPGPPADLMARAVS